MIQNNIILEKLRMQIPTTEYNQYVSKLYIDTQHSNENTIIFLAQNLFLANWAKRNYADKILQIIEHETGKKPQTCQREDETGDRPRVRYAESRS